MKTKMILLCACIIITNNLWAETTLDIDGAVRQALENNLSLQRSRMEITTAKRKADRSWNSLIPSLSTGAVFSHPTSITGTLPNTVDVWTPLFSFSARDNLSLAQNKLLSEQYNLVSVILELEKELNLPFGSIGRTQ